MRIYFNKVDMYPLSVTVYQWCSMKNKKRIVIEKLQIFWYISKILIVRRIKKLNYIKAFVFSYAEEEISFKFISVFIFSLPSFISYKASSTAA